VTCTGCKDTEKFDLEGGKCVSKVVVEDCSEGEFFGFTKDRSSGSCRSCGENCNKCLGYIDENNETVVRVCRECGNGFYE
jgi:flavoprotein